MRVTGTEFGELRGVVGGVTSTRQVQGRPHEGGGTQAESSKMCRCALGRQGSPAIHKREQREQRDEAQQSSLRGAARGRGWSRA